MSAESLERVACCDLCGGRESREYEVYERFGERFPLVECTGCGLAYLSRRPPEAGMAAWYDKLYNRRHRTFRPRPEREWIFRLLRTLLQWRYAGGLRAAVVRTVFFPWERRWKAILTRSHLEGITHIGRMLDVGCGHGAWLAGMRRWGFDCHGVEPSDEGVRAVRELGLPVHHGQLTDAELPAGFFDVVRLNHVLEHTHRPCDTLAEAARVLAPGGRLIVSVPNHDGVAARAMRLTEDVPYHLYSFSPSTLEAAFEKAGLQVERVWTATPHPHDLYSYFALRAAEMLADVSPEEQEKAEAFWSSENADRVRDFTPTVRWFDAIGHGCEVTAVGVKR